MRGDFSDWNKHRSQNFRGTLHQQGRVMLDLDLNDQTEIFNDWQDTAARDIIGAGVAGVPAGEKDSFKVTEARVVAGPPKSVSVTIKKGRVWADGLPIELANDKTLRATYLGPQNQIGAIPASGLRDAVILETWVEELNAFQKPELLLEPALGGVDTSERVQTAFRLRLVRLDSPEKTCTSIVSDLKNFSGTGTLAVKLDPAEVIDDNCPVTESGGYTGFEHELYRIEIAETSNENESWFKWSQFNGGLVGTGDFDAAGNTVVIQGNKNAIIYSGLKDFYLEALDFDEDLGHWRPIYGAKAKLASDNTLTLLTGPGDTLIGSVTEAAKKTKCFFRLWNGIERVNGFVTVEKLLPNNVGIKLQFAPEGPGKYMPSDFWTFTVRAGDLGNPTDLLPQQRPQGIFYHRVPLAELNWKTNQPAAADIEDCRQIFLPLTKRTPGCCTYRVGDGRESFGDFTSIQEAIDALPREDGGEICVLPGIYPKSIIIEGRRNITLHGCGLRSRLEGSENGDSPMIAVVASQNIRIESLMIDAGKGAGIFITGPEEVPGGGQDQKLVHDISLSRLFIATSCNSAVRASNVQNFLLTDSLIHIRDTGNIGDDFKRSLMTGIDLSGEDMLVKGCRILVIGEKGIQQVPAKIAAGGIKIAGGSERVSIIGNTIDGGTGNGITLGSIDLFIGEVGLAERNALFIPKSVEPLYPDFIRLGEKNERKLIPTAGLPITDVLIKSNHIQNMGRNGIGVINFFELNASINALNMVSVVGLEIAENRIVRCAWRNDGKFRIPENMLRWMGRGAIALARAESVYIRDNFLGDNGPDSAASICGIFVLHAEVIEISRNQIFGPTDGDFRLLRPGKRGGIWIENAVISNPSNITGRSPAAVVQENVVAVQVGRSLTLRAKGPASIVNNSFTTLNPEPVNPEDVRKLANGQLTTELELLLDALFAGNVRISDSDLIPSVQKLLKSIINSGGQTGGGQTGGGTTTTSGSHLTYSTLALRSFLLNPVRFQSGTTVTSASTVDFASTPTSVSAFTSESAPAPVSIMTSGLSSLRSTVNRETSAAFTSTLTPDSSATLASTTTSANFPLATASGPRNVFFDDLPIFTAPYHIDTGIFTFDPGVNVPVTPGPTVPAGSGAALLPAPPMPAPLFSDSNFLLSGNQCYQGAAVLEKPTFILSSILVSSSFDVAFNDNYSGCLFVPGILSLINTFIEGAVSSRIESNRFTENLESDPVGSTYPVSAYTKGYMNITMGNIATHCILAENGTGKTFVETNVVQVKPAGPCTNVKPSSNVRGILQLIVDAMDKLHSNHLGIDLNISVQANQTIRYQLAKSMVRFGESDTRTQALKRRVDIDTAELKFNAIQYTAASTPLAEADAKGWAIDGFVHTTEGEAVNKLTVAAYDDKSVWQKDLGHICTDEKGYFSLVVKKFVKVPPPSPVFLRVSVGDKFLSSTLTTVFPAAGVSDRVEIIVRHDEVLALCAPPPGERIDPGPKPAPPPDENGPATPTVPPASDKIDPVIKTTPPASDKMDPVIKTVPPASDKADPVIKTVLPAKEKDRADPVTKIEPPAKEKDKAGPANKTEPPSDKK